jgi:hypothetical protein
MPHLHAECQIKFIHATGSMIKLNFINKIHSQGKILTLSLLS